MFKNNFFQGWYFKCCNNEHTIAFIAAYHISNNHKTASLQIITDDAVLNIPFDSLSYRENPLYISLGRCIFSENGIRLNIHTDTLSVHGVLKFRNLSPVSYDIMGPFKIFPFMQCRHTIISMKHRIDGKININGEQCVFNNGTGYIEGDSGRSFPEQYLWTQCFFRNGSIMLSVADIPISFFNFTGIIGIIMMSKHEYRIATYLGARIKDIGSNYVVIQQGNFQITAVLVQKNSYPLYAPDNGIMSRTIRESASCKAYYQFLYKDKILCEFSSNSASFEIEY